MTIVDKKLFTKLHEIWEKTKGKKFEAIQEFLNNTFIDPNADKPSWERCLIYGKLTTGDRMIETYAGTLTAIAPEVIIIETQFPFMPKITGLVRRSNLTPFLFESSSFELGDVNCLYIEASDESKNQKLNLPINCPAFFSFEFGAGMSKSVEQLGIDPTRWLMLSAWLDKWLPQNTR